MYFKIVAMVTLYCISGGTTSRTASSCKEIWSTWDDCKCPNGTLIKRRNCQPGCWCTGSTTSSVVCSYDDCQPIRLQILTITLPVVGGVVLVVLIVSVVVINRNWDKLGNYRRKKESVKWKPQIVYAKPMIVEESERPASCPYVNAEFAAAAIISGSLISALQSHENLIAGDGSSCARSTSGYKRGSYAYPKIPEVDTAIYENCFYPKVDHSSRVESF